jgi:hypothetical protein
VAQHIEKLTHVVVYLLEEGPGGTRTRVAQTPAQTPVQAAYTQRLLAWLRQQDRWCCEAEALASVLLPDSSSATGDFYRSCLEQQRDAVAMIHNWRCIAAMRDGAPPPPPSLHEIDEIELRWKARTAAAAAEAMPRARAAAEHRPPRSSITAAGDNAAALHAASAVRSHDMVDAGVAAGVSSPGDGTASLQAAARVALLDQPVKSRGVLLPDGLLSRIALRRRASDGLKMARLSGDELHAALAAAPLDFALVPQFWNGIRHVAVYLLQEGPGGTRTRVAQTLPQTPEEAAYTQRLLAWLRQQDRWCCEAEVLACVPPPDAQHTCVLLRSCAAQQADAVAMSHSWRCIAALRDGQPPAPPPDARQMRRIDLEWAQRSV